LRDGGGPPDVGSMMQFIAVRRFPARGAAARRQVADEVAAE
jgi:hypothetical protein